MADDPLRDGLRKIGHPDVVIDDLRSQVSTLEARLAEVTAERDRAQELIKRYRRPMVDDGVTPAERLHVLKVRSEDWRERAERAEKALTALTGALARDNAAGVWVIFPQSWPKTLYLCPECGNTFIQVHDHWRRLSPDHVHWCSGGVKGGDRHEGPVRCESVLVKPMDRAPSTGAGEQPT